MAYLYRHIRLDKNIPFYIGIGSDDDYKRAYNVRSRNRYWVNIVAKSHYEVEILLDNLTWLEACEKEIEFISLYKRRRDGGTLANLTLGGEGQLGMIPWNFGKETPEETRKKQSIRKKGKPSKRRGCKISQHVIDAMARGREGLTIWNKGLSPSEETKERRKKSMEGKYKTGADHPMYGTKMPDYIKEKLRIANASKPVWNVGKK